MNTRKRQNDHSFSLLSSPKTIFSSPVMDLTTSRIHCNRSGMEKDFYKLEFGSWVNIVACTGDDAILLIHQYRYGSDRVEIEIPGGAVNDNEPPLQAGLRELLEETGYQGDNGQIIGKVCPNPAIQGNSCYTVLVENARKIREPEFDDMEDISVAAVPERDVFKLIEDGVLNHGLVLNGLMFYAMHKQKNFW